MTDTGNRNLHTHYVCPKCKSIEVRLSMDLGVGEQTAQCPICEWSGLASETQAVLTGEELWTAERLAMVLVNAVNAHAVGPLLLLYERIGMVPSFKREADDEVKAEDLEEYNTAVLEFRSVAGRVLAENVIVRSMETLDRLNAIHSKRWGLKDPYKELINRADAEKETPKVIA